MSTLIPRLVVITGAGSGIGRATALAFGALGAHVAVSDINLTAAKQTADAITADGGDASAHQLDVTDHHQWLTLADTVLDSFGPTDVLVNNAGFTTAGRFLDHSVADWESLIAVNVKGVIHGSRVFGRQMITQRVHGQIINVASAAAYTPIVASSPYCATKSAVKMFSECLRSELAPHHIGVTAICPGAINTDFYRSARHVGLNAEEAEFRRTTSAGLIDRVGHGPDTIARAIVKAARTNPAIKPVTFEAYLGWIVSRLSPAAMRVFAHATDADRLSAVVRRFRRDKDISAVTSTTEGAARS
jgi:NAD(P)-dependent dehydrogenase (short-subunit alcohol dehydrogenase family)